MASSNSDFRTFPRNLGNSSYCAFTVKYGQNYWKMPIPIAKMCVGLSERKSESSFVEEKKVAEVLNLIVDWRMDVIKCQNDWRDVG